MRNKASTPSLLFYKRYPRILCAIRHKYDEYLHDISWNVIIQRHQVNPNRIAVIKYTHHAHEDYLRKVMRKLKPLKHIQSDGVHMIITSDPKRCWSYTYMYKKLTEGWKRLRAYIEKNEGKMDFLSIELTRYGLLHVHIFIFGKKFVIDKRKLSELTKKYRLGEVTYLGYRIWGKSTFDYMMKYFVKQWRNIRGIGPNKDTIDLIYGQELLLEVDGKNIPYH